MGVVQQPAIAYIRAVKQTVHPHTGWVRRLFLAAILPVLVCQFVLLSPAGEQEDATAYPIMTLHRAVADPDLERVAVEGLDLPRFPAAITGVPQDPEAEVRVSGTRRAVASILRYLLVLHPLRTSQLCTSSL